MHQKKLLHLPSQSIIKSRARCVPLQYQSKTAHGVKIRPNPATKEIPSATGDTQEDFVVRSHLTQREDWQQPKSITRDPCVAMFSSNMECERYQDLSELSWFSSVAQPWGAAEPRIPDPNMHSNGSQAFETIDYAYDFDGQLYTLPRSDSMEEVKTATAMKDVLPMRDHEAVQVEEFVKIEQEDITVDEKFRPDFLRIDSLDTPDPILFDTPDLLNEIGDRDLIDFIVSDVSPQASESSHALSTPPPVARVAPFPQTSVASVCPHPATSVAAKKTLNTLPAASITLATTPPKAKKLVKETYLAIPRELTSGSSEDKKIPKMLILKTPQTTTINLQDIAMSIAERIKTVGKRQRTKRYSEIMEEAVDEVDQDEESEDAETEGRPNKRARRTSTTSSASLSDRYRELRDRNNEASRKSRQNRKEKEKDIQISLEQTEQENSRLRARADELEKLVLSLRKLLLQIVVRRGSER